MHLNKAVDSEVFVTSQLKKCILSKVRLVKFWTKNEK